MDDEVRPSIQNTHPIILFDGVCHLCNGFVRFLLHRDKARDFRFAPLQSERARKLLASFNPADTEFDTLLLLEHGEIFTLSDAVLRIARRIGGPWYLLSYLSFLPASIRNSVYRLVARNRYRMFGRREECMVPPPDMPDRFLQ